MAASTGQAGVDVTKKPDNKWNKEWVNDEMKQHFTRGPGSLCESGPNNGCVLGLGAYLT